MLLRCEYVSGSLLIVTRLGYLVCLSLSLYLPACLFVFVCVWFSFFVCLPVWLSLRLSLCLSLCLSLAL